MHTQPVELYSAEISTLEQIITIYLLRYSFENFSSMGRLNAETDRKVKAANVAKNGPSVHGMFSALIFYQAFLIKCM